MRLALWDAVDAADVVLHAGDWVDVTLLDALSARARRLVACSGDNDGPALRARLPEVGRDRRRQPHCTYMTADVADGRLTGVTPHRIVRAGTG